MEFAQNAVRNEPHPSRFLTCDETSGNGELHCRWGMTRMMQFASLTASYAGGYRLTRLLGTNSRVDGVLNSRISSSMRTVIETPTFQKQAEKIWSEDERMAFIAWIAEHPNSGDVIHGSGGARKVRWSVAGKGKRGGVRVIYFHLTEQGIVVLVTLYQKASQANIQTDDIKKAM